MREKLTNQQIEKIINLSIIEDYDIRNDLSRFKTTIKGSIKLLRDLIAMGLIDNEQFELYYDKIYAEVKFKLEQLRENMALIFFS